MTRWRTVLATCVAMACLASATAFGSADLKGADFDEFLTETQKEAKPADDLTSVWWIPNEFWILSEADEPSMTKDELEEMLAALSPYTLVAVVEGRLGALGAPSFQSEAEVRAHTKLKDRRGVKYDPLPLESADVSVKVLLGAMKPLMAGVMGPTGENMHFLLFPAKSKSGDPLADAQQEGTFSIEVGTREFKWRLPLSSLLPPKLCPTCGERLSGAFKFCPWDGTKLPEPAAAKESDHK